MSFQPINPKPYITSLVGSRVVVRLKFNEMEYKGTLLSIDNYMNILLDKDVLEYPQGTDGDGIPLNNEIFVRCNNVMWIGKDLQ